jgi:sugar diacid utilization regulator
MFMTPRSRGRSLPILDPATRAVCAQVADRLELEATDLAASMTAAVFDEIPEYAAAATERMRQGVLDHSLDHVRAIASAIRGWELPSGAELDFVRTRASLRATQQVPLSALLHSYRLGHRTVWERLVRLLAGLDNILDASLALTTLTLTYTELISGALAEGYVEQQRQMLVERDRDRRDLLENILRGTLDRQSDTPRLASNFALVPGGDFLVVVMTSLSDSTAPTSAALTRAAETLGRHFTFGVAQPFVVVRHAEIVSIAPLARARAASIARLARQAHAELGQRGEQWAAGISTVCVGLGEVARGYQEARLAVESASTSAGVCALLETRVSEYVLQRADSTAVRMIPAAGRRLFESPRVDDQLLVETLLAYARADMAIRVAADELCVHPNTVSYRLHKLNRLLDRDLSKFGDLVEVVTWARVLGKGEAL